MPPFPWILRSLLFVPGSRSDMMAKAAGYGADAIILDLEDGVAGDAKPQARANIAAALERGLPGARAVLVRINGVESGLLEEDLAKALRPAVDAICLPKCHSPQEIHGVDVRLARLENAWRLPRGRIRLIPMIETARGVVHASAIADAHPRVTALGFGAEDFTADVGVARTREGAELAFARAAVSVAAHAAGVLPLDGIYADFRDIEGLRADAAVARSLGYQGKMLIHPAQIDVVHGAFAPTSIEVEQARRVVAAFEAAEARGAGIAVVDGAMVDRPVVLRAQRVLEIATGPG